MAKTITHNGQTKTLGEWGVKLGMTPASVTQRLRRGWTEAEAVSTPAGQTPDRLLKGAEKPARKAKGGRKPKPYLRVLRDEAATREPAASAGDLDDLLRAACDLMRAAGLEVCEGGAVENWQLFAVRRRA